MLVKPGEERRRHQNRQSSEEVITHVGRLEITVARQISNADSESRDRFSTMKLR
jgi:hypothetical protein